MPAGPSRSAIKINYEIGMNTANITAKQHAARIKDSSPMVSSSRKTVTSKENTVDGRLNTEGGLTENTIKRRTLNRNKTSMGAIAVGSNKILQRENRLSR